MFWFFLISFYVLMACGIGLLIYTLDREMKRSQGFLESSAFWFTKFLWRDRQAIVWKRAAKKYYKLNKSLTSKYNWEAKN